MALTTMFSFERAHLEPIAAAQRPLFASATPFPHVIIDGLLPEEVIDALIAEFPEPGDATWQEFNLATEVKLALRDTAQMGPVARNVLAELNGQVFIEFLEQLTGIEHLVPDPHYVGGGMHQILRGGFLKVHADFNLHPGLQLDRRLNVLLYLNRDWDPAWGGDLELWERDMSGVSQKVAPLANRMVVFATTDSANHGHPDPLVCPESRARRSLALYYYTNGRPAEELNNPHSTLFRSRPGERISTSARDRLRRWVPPALVDLAHGKQR